MSKKLELLLPYQKRALKISRDNRLSVFEKSRRTGLTYAFGADAVLTASAAKGGMNYFYIAYNQDMTREFIDYCSTFAKAFNIAASPNEFLFDDGSEKGIKAFRIDFPSGHSIVALSSKPRSLRGKQGVVLIDEAAFHEALEELLKAAIALLMWGGRVIVISTHDGADNPFNELIGDIRGGKKNGVVMRLTLDDALKDGLYKRICLREGIEWTAAGEAAWKDDIYKTYGDAAEEELDVIPARGSGTYLARATIEAAMSTDHHLVRITCADGFERQTMEWRESWIWEQIQEYIQPHIRKMDQNKYSYFGQDFARSTDLSAVAIGQFDDLANLICQLIIEMRNVPFREQLIVMNALCDAMPLFSAGKMDGRGNGQQLAETMVDTWGEMRIEAVMASQKTYLEMMPRLKTRIEDRTLIMPKNDGVVEDLRCIKLVKGIPSIVDRVRDKSDGAKARRHGDTAIALMHLVAAADSDAGPIEFFSAGRRDSGGVEQDFSTTSYGSVRRSFVDDGYNL